MLLLMWTMPGLKLLLSWQWIYVQVSRFALDCNPLWYFSEDCWPVRVNGCFIWLVPSWPGSVHQLLKEAPYTWMGSVNYTYLIHKVFNNLYKTLLAKAVLGQTATHRASSNNQNFLWGPWKSLNVWLIQPEMRNRTTWRYSCQIPTVKDKAPAEYTMMSQKVCCTFVW